jgi:nucleoside 2-deoxyribosyltransferase
MTELFSKEVVYIAGPYTHPEPIENTKKAIDVWNQLTDAGYIAIVPHNTLLMHLCYPKEANFWYEYDLCIMRKCDAVVRIPGFSEGADKEVLEANRLGIPVYSLGELLKKDTKDSIHPVRKAKYKTVKPKKVTRKTWVSRSAG